MTASVVVTGVGTVSARFAGGAAALGAHLALPRSPAPAALVVEDGALAALVDADAARRCSRVSRLAVAAARLALVDAGLGPGATELGIYVGTEFGDLRSTMEFADGYLERGPAGLSALLFPNTVMNTMAAATSIATGARDACVTLTAPTVAGELAVARAVTAVASGRVPVALAGGVDQLEAEVTRWVARLGCDAEVRGEGATFLVLEPYEAARRRGAPVLGGIAGVSWAALPARPAGVGRRTDSRAIVTALAVAGVGADAIRWAYRSACDDAARDAWERGVMARALGGTPRPTATLVRGLGQHAGVGALRVAAAAWTARSGLLPREDGHGVTRVGVGPGLVHGLARGGTHVALVVTAP